MKYFWILLLTFTLTLQVSASNKAVVDITSMSIKDLSEALDKGYLTSELLVELYLNRVETYDKDFNSINQINESALEEARKLDAERESGKVRSYLHGIPILVKTNIDVTGLATTDGATALADNFPLEDAEVIKKLKEAGAIILGSTNMSQFAFSAADSLSSYGNVKNAFNPLYTPAGSSGGSGVAIALSFAAASLGTDTNASVRLPASASSLVGLRPTFDLISTDGVIPYDVERDTVGILSKTVGDNAIILDIIAEDEKTFDIDETFDLKDIKIGVIDSYVYGKASGVSINAKTDSDIVKLTEEKLKVLEENGAELVHIDVLVDEYYRNIANSTMTGVSFCDGFNEYIKGTTSRIRSFSELASSSGLIYSLSGYRPSCNGVWTRALESKNTKKRAFEEHIIEIMEEYDVDVIIYPSQKLKLFKLGSDASLNAPGSALGSVIGYPSITVPMGFIEGLPYGLEFFSIKNSEELLYNVASKFEELNDLDITNSPLAPSLYEVPNYLDELMSNYENYLENDFFDELTVEVREYFEKYSDRSIEENESEALKILEAYETLEIEEEEILRETEFISGAKIRIFVYLMLRIIVLFVRKKKYKRPTGN